MTLIHFGDLAYSILKDEDKWKEIAELAIHEIRKHKNYYLYVLTHQQQTKIRTESVVENWHVIQALAESIHVSIGIITKDEELFMAKSELSPLR